MKKTASKKSQIDKIRQEELSKPMKSATKNFTPNKEKPSNEITVIHPVKEKK